MHTGKRYTPLEFFRWTRKDTIWMLIISAAPTASYAMGLKFVALPWQPVAILGTAVAFIVGLKNNASYKGSANDVPITQISRTIGIDMRDMPDETSLPEPIIPINNIVL